MILWRSRQQKLHKYVSMQHSSTPPTCHRYIANMSPSFPANKVLGCKFNFSDFKLAVGDTILGQTPVDQLTSFIVMYAL